MLIIETAPKSEIFSVSLVMLEEMSRSFLYGKGNVAHILPPHYVSCKHGTSHPGTKANDVSQSWIVQNVSTL